MYLFSVNLFLIIMLKEKQNEDTKRRKEEKEDKIGVRCWQFGFAFIDGNALI